MSRLDEVTFDLMCGARVTVRVKVDVTRCRRGDGGCPTAAEVASMIWMAMRDEEERAPTPEDCDSDGG
jgi:hypothetical protein